MPPNLNDSKVLWGQLKNPDFWAEVSPSSHISSHLDLDPIAPAQGLDVELFERDGIGTARAVPFDIAERAARIVSEIHRSGLPPAFAFVFDELWEPARYCYGHARTLLDSCELRADAWAWLVPPGEAGWAGHRDFHGQSSDGLGHSEVLTVWLALSSITRDDAAMNVVPRSRDPHWPDSMANAPDPSLGLTLTGEPGEVFFWDGDVYHWSSPGTALRRGPRISASYTFAARSGLHVKSSLDPTFFGLEQRLDMMARGIIDYYYRLLAVPTALLEWALRWNTAAGFLQHP